MNISTELVRFDAHLAICAALLREGDLEVKVYASAMASETPFFADLAQKRAMQLALDVQAQGGEAILGLSYLEHLPCQASVPPLRSEPIVAELPFEMEDVINPLLSKSEPNDKIDNPLWIDFPDEAPL